MVHTIHRLMEFRCPIQMQSLSSYVWTRNIETAQIFWESETELVYEIPTLQVLERSEFQFLCRVWGWHKPTIIQSHNL